MTVYKYCIYLCDVNQLIGKYIGYLQRKNIYQTHAYILKDKTIVC